MTRYKTKHYVTADEQDARRLAKLDETPWDDVQISAADPLHVSDDLIGPGFILWSDGVITGGVGYKGARPKSLSKDAAHIIATSRGSDTPASQQRLREIADIDRILTCHELWTGGTRGHYAPDNIKRLRVRMRGGSERTFFVRSVGYFEGYSYEISDRIEDLR